MNRLTRDTRAAVVSALVEGVGIRATCRMTSCSKGAVTKLIADLGPVCEAYQDAVLRNLPCRVLEVDEIWSFVHAKARNVPPAKRGVFGYGDVWTFTAICADTKLIPTWHVGPRDSDSALVFMSDLARRMAGPVQITTDGHSMYPEAIEAAFGSKADYAMLVKLYGAPQEPEKRYSPAQCIGAYSARVQGSPNPARVSTSYVERSNLSLRMGLRRFTRLTNAYSKKLQNHCAALAIYFMNYNFARLHQTIRVTPAMKAGVTNRLWKVTDIVKLLEAAEVGQESVTSK